MSIYGYTTNFSFALSNFDTPNWHEEDWARWRTVDSLLVAQSSIPFAVTTGSSNAYVATYSPAITAYTNNLLLSFKTNFANTGAATINVNGLGAKTLKINGADLIANDLPNGSYVRVIYDGTNFAVIDPKKPVNQVTDVIIDDTGGTKNASTAFLIEKAANTYSELLGSNISTQGYMFSRPSASFAGGILYDHVNEEMLFVVDEVTVGTLTDAGVLTLDGFVGPLTGNVTGSASSLTTARTLSYTGDATGSLSFDGTANASAALTIANNAVTNAKAADMPTARIKGRISAGAGDPEDLTSAQATSILDFFLGDTGTGGTKGLVPAPQAGAAAAGFFLRADGAWVQTAPVGSVLIHSGNVPPTGYLEANGAAVSRTTYAALFSLYSSQSLLAVYGVGDGSTTFNLPDYRGEFPRGWDNGRGVDTGRAMGSAQSGSIEAHVHSISPPTASDDTSQGNTTTGVGGAESITPYNSGSYGGAETRPRNVAVMFCVKY
jgi:microcystin-dependent protein